MNTDWKSKLTSRKFWICVAAFLASIATSISGIAVANDSIIGIGIVCGVISAAIYAAAEAAVDSASAKSTTTQTVTQTAKTVTATSTDRETVKQAIAPVEIDDKVGGTE